MKVDKFMYEYCYYSFITAITIIDVASPLSEANY
jgi:hypothetical protein